MEGDGGPARAQPLRGGEVPGAPLRTAPRLAGTEGRQGGGLIKSKAIKALIPKIVMRASSPLIPIWQMRAIRRVIPTGHMRAIVHVIPMHTLRAIDVLIPKFPVRGNCLPLGGEMLTLQVHALPGRICFVGYDLRGPSV